MGTDPQSLHPELDMGALECLDPGLGLGMSTRQNDQELLRNTMCLLKTTILSYRLLHSK